MLITGVCRECKLTRKAVEYYMEQGLICPAVMENGYRSFSEDDIKRLKQISVLRGLGLSVPQIMAALNSSPTVPLQKISYKKDLEIQNLREKHRLLEKLADDGDWESARARLDVLEIKQTVLQRMSDKFPDYYGRYLCMHFELFLDEPIATGEQQEAFDTIISFIDGVDIKIPEDLKDFLAEMTKETSNEDLFNLSEKVSEAVNVAISDTDKYMAENKEMLDEWMKISNSAEYKSSPAYRVKKLFEDFNSQHGYNDIFIPAMERLSPSYRKYREKLLKANEKFIQLF